MPFVDTLTVYVGSSAWRKAWDFSQEDGYYFILDNIPDADLLSIDSITLDGTAISSSYYRLGIIDGYSSRVIVFDKDNVTFPTSASFSTSLVITGTWGYHNNPDTMWQDSGDSVQDASLSDSAPPDRDWETITREEYPSIIPSR